MNNSRESIYAALFARVSGAAQFATIGRKLQSIAQMQPSSFPALFQQQIGEETVPGRGIPPRYTMRVDLVIYAINQDTSQSATPQINELLDAVEAALAPNIVTGVQTLGGLVSHCYISGKTDIFEGDLGNRAAAVVPIEILTT